MVPRNLGWLFHVRSMVGIALAIMQLIEGVAAGADGSGDSIGHEVPGWVNLVVFQPMVLLAMVVLAVVALRTRRAAAKR